MSTLPETTPHSIKREDCTYTKCYCEENVYKLVEALVERKVATHDSLYVVFISNTNKTVPFWCQKSVIQEGGYIVWDYHVVLVEKREGGAVMWDLDTTLEFPCGFVAYAERALLSFRIELNERYKRMFRVVPAISYLKHFASNRSHMLMNGQWAAPPPAYPCIVSHSGEEMTLPLFWDMSETGTQEEGYGCVMSEKEFIERFSSTGK